MRPMKDHAMGPECCEGRMAQIILPANIAPVLGGGSWPGYENIVTGEFVTSRRRHREILKEHNLVEKG